MRTAVSKTLLTTLLTLAFAFASISDSSSLAHARLVDNIDIIATPFSRLIDSLRLESIHLDNRITELSAADSSVYRRLMLPVISPELRSHLQTMRYFEPVVITPVENDESRLVTRIDMQRRYIDVFLSNIEGRRSLVDQLPTLTPTVGTYTSSFGYRVHPISGRVKMHEGIDLSAPGGTPIRASGNGVVSFAGRRNGYGNTVQIAHAFGYATLYGHCSKLLVKEGDTVSRGDIIALVGSTGASTGPHLHYEVSVDGTKVAPDGFLLEEPIRPIAVETSATETTRPASKSKGTKRGSRSKR